MIDQKSVKNFKIQTKNVLKKISDLIRVPKGHGFPRLKTLMRVRNPVNSAFRIHVIMMVNRQQTCCPYMNKFCPALDKFAGALITSKDCNTGKYKVWIAF